MTPPDGDAAADATPELKADVPLDAHPDVPPISGNHLRLELGPATAGLDGKTPPIVFSVPPQTTAWTATLQGSPDQVVQLAEVTGPDGLVIVPKAWLTFADDPWVCLQDCPNRVKAVPGQAAFLVPNTPVISLEPGPHRLVAYAFGPGPNQTWVPRPGPLQVRVDLVRKTAQELQKGRLDLTLCLTGAMGVTAAVAPQHPRIQQALEDVATLLAPVGLKLGQVRFVDVEAPGLIVHHDDLDSELSALFATGKGQPLGVPVFLVEKVVTGEQGAVVVAGLSGGIPGPPLEIGGPRAGIAVSLALGVGQTDQLGRVIAHEIGHFLGLYHTTESSEPGATPVHDTLPDTPQTDVANLMYWSPGADSAKLTPQQGKILQSSPWVTPLP